MDSETGKDYSYRRDWIVNRIKELSVCFAIDIFAYSVMENHWHVVLYVDPDRVASWSDEDVVDHWCSIYASRRKKFSGTKVSAKKIKQWRKRLGSVSWFMKSVNEPIARRANKEDGCSGHFWEGRFGSTTLLDDRAVLAGMAYVDLNPVKAAMAKSLEDSDYTSIQIRLEDLHWIEPKNSDTSIENSASNEQTQNTNACVLPMFSSTNADSSQPLVPISPANYIRFVASLIPRHNLHGETSANSPIVGDTIFGIPLDEWAVIVNDFDRLFRIVAGAPEAVRSFLADVGLDPDRMDPGADLLGGI